MAAKTAQKELMLEGLRSKWYSLDKPDYKFNQAGVYGVGAVLDDTARDLLNDAITEVARISGEAGKTYEPGDLLKANMDASRRDRKTGELEKFTPLVYLPDLSPATATDLAKIGRNTKFTLKVKVRSYPAIGKPNDDGQYENGGRAGGVSVKFAALQILTFDAGEPSATEQGFTAAASAGNEAF